MKIVTISLKMDDHFVRMLNDNVALSGLRDKLEKGEQLQPIDQLALLVLVEARGGTTEDIEQAITNDWCENISVIPEARTVEELVKES